MRMQFYEDLFRGANVNILVVAFRGYSLSQGVPSEKGILNDGLDIIEYAFSRDDVFDTERIFVAGKTLGAAVAIWTASQPGFRVKGGRRLSQA